MSAPALLSGPCGLPLIGNLPTFARDPFGFFTRLQRDYGDIAGFTLGAPAVLLSHPNDIEHVLVKTGKEFHKGYQQGFAFPLVLGNGLLTSEGDFWRMQRKRMAPAFHARHIAGYADTMVRFTEQMVVDWSDGQTRDVHQDMMHLTQRIVAKTLFSSDVEGAAQDVGRALDVIIHEMDAELKSVPQVLLPMLPWPSRARLRAAVKCIDNVVYGIINARRADAGNQQDLLALLIEACDDEGHGMSDKQLRDEVLTLYVAGHETTATTLSWAWVLLAQYPAVRAALESELTHVLSGRSPTLEDVQSLPYTEAVIKEAMRLYPPVWTISRVASHDVEIGGYAIPQGTEIYMSQWVTHHDRRWFDLPDRFMPERWMGGIEQRLPKYAYFPFGGGPRICIGNRFAMMEAVLLLATIAQRYRLELGGHRPVELDASLTLRPKHGVVVQLQQRSLLAK